jgi:hypothetical protein
MAQFKQFFEIIGSKFLRSFLHPFIVLESLFDKGFSTGRVLCLLQAVNKGTGDFVNQFGLVIAEGSRLFFLRSLRDLLLSVKAGIKHV